MASDASKPYPTVPTTITSPLKPAGPRLRRARPRSAALSEQRLLQRLAPGPAARRVQLDLRRARQRRRLRADRRGHDLPHEPASWGEYVASETRVMFRHLTGNDPRPHFFHQSNLADYNPALPDDHPARAASCTRSSTRCWTATTRLRPRGAPLVQLTSGRPRRRSSARRPGRRRRAAVRRGSRTGAYTCATRRLGGRRAADRDDRGRPTAASARAGSRSRRAPQASYAPADPASTAAPGVGHARVGETLTVSDGAVDRRAGDRLRPPVAALRRLALREHRRRDRRDLRARRRRRRDDAAGRGARPELDLLGEPGVLRADRRSRRSR